MCIVHACEVMLSVQIGLSVSMLSSSRPTEGGGHHCSWGCGLSLSHSCQGEGEGKGGSSLQSGSGSSRDGNMAC